VPFPGQVIAGPYHQVLGEGCVYPAAVQTLGNQLSAAGRSWAAYMQDMGNDPARDTTVTTARGPACGHPATWAIDHTQNAAKGDQYAERGRERLEQVLERSSAVDLTGHEGTVDGGEREARANGEAPGWREEIRTCCAGRIANAAAD
jgi:hypothetical protein